MNRRRSLSGLHRESHLRAIGVLPVLPTTRPAGMPLTRLNDAQVNEAGAALLPRTAREVCPDCYGTGETEQHVTDDITRMLPCPECGGRGYYKEAE